MPRTSDLRYHDDRTPDEFYYRSILSNGASELHPVPPEYVLPEEGHGGFGVMDTGGKGLGYSWFLFIGPPEIRAREPLGDWRKVVEEYAKTHRGRKRVEWSGPYPTPGRLKQPSEKLQPTASVPD